MKKIIMIIALLAISMPVYALKPMEDGMLSTVSGPDSLNMKTPERARLVLHKPVKKDSFKGIGHPLMESARQLCYAILYGDGDTASPKASKLVNLKLAFFTTPQGYKETFISTSDFETDLAKGEYDPYVVYNARSDTGYSLSDPISSMHSIYYITGDYRRSDDVQTWIVRSSDGTEMRDRYLKDTSTYVHPKSWVDVKKN